jgi:hypothetical protein
VSPESQFAGLAKPAGTDNPISNPDDVAGYLIANIKNSARDNMRIQVYRIEITFYFDNDERMIDYRAGPLEIGSNRAGALLNGVWGV